MAAAALCSTTIKMGGGNAPRRRRVMNVHWWRASTSAHPEAPSRFHLNVHAPFSHCIHLQHAQFHYSPRCLFSSHIHWVCLKLCVRVGATWKMWRWEKVKLREYRQGDRGGNQEWEEEKHPHPRASSPRLNPPPPYNFSLGASYKPTIYLHYAPEIAICRFAGKK